METSQKIYKILVVEDNLGDFTLIESYLLEQFGTVSLHHCTSFKETQHQLQSNQEEIDVILLDLSLPDHKGMQLISDVIAICATIPVLVLTGYGDMDFGIKSLALGASDYIFKNDLSPALLHKSIIYSVERKRSFAALQESEKQYTELFQLSPQPMWVYDPGKGCFLDANYAAISQYGYSRNEFLAMSDCYIQENINVYERGNTIQSNSTGTGLHMKKDGTYIKVDLHRNIIELKGKTAFIILANDVSERLDYINAVEAQNKMLKEISWIQSHKVRAPVARILGLVSLLQSNDGLEDERGQIVEYLNTSVSELDLAIKDISKKMNIQTTYR
ncbi:MAG: response regulator [Pedobacter sp.]|nr:MAG: response regulator [Pedobacter sp.]